MAELKPLEKCPFCGKEDGLYVESDQDGYVLFYYIHCMNCDTKGPSEITKQQAIDAWNKRS